VAIRWCAVRGSGAAVALVRQSRAWTQADLAEAAGMSQGYISKVENGQLELEGTPLIEVAGALQVPPALLAIRDPSLGTGVSCVRHRRRRSKLTVATTRRIEGLAHLASLTVTGLVRELPAPLEPKVPALVDADGRPAVTAARHLRNTARLGDRPVPNVLRLIEDMQVAVVRRDLATDGQDAVSLRLAERHPVILVNTALSGDRQRFTLAHELGHLTLHGWDVATADDAIEQEANLFAAELLAPGEIMREELAGLTARDFRRLLELKHRWGVSMAALIEQARHLDIVDEQLHRTLRIRLNEYGWTRVEPGDVPVEEPTLVPRIVDGHLDQLGRPVEKVAATALMLPGPFRKHYLQHRAPADGEEVVT